MTTDVFQFMSLRSANSIDEKRKSANYIKDDFWSRDLVDKILAKQERNIGNAVIDDPTTQSKTGKLVFDIAFDSGSLAQNASDTNSKILSRILVENYPSISMNPNGIDSISLQELEHSPYIISNDMFYRVPEKIEYMSIGGSRNITRAYQKIREGLQQQNIKVESLTQDLEDIFELPLPALVFRALKIRESAGSADSILFDDGNAHFPRNLYSSRFGEMKSSLFEALYTLYILRTKISLNTEYVIHALQVLHVVEQLALDTYLRAPGKVKDALKIVLSAVVNANAQAEPLLTQRKLLQNYFDAIPVIHPIFARLARYPKPFNEIKPIGIGDLKVVKQKLLGYRIGEIANIHNVLKGEVYNKTHRRLDKTETSISISSDQTSTTEKENQTTDKYELKREADQVIKSDMQINVATGATFNYGGGAIVANISAGMSYHTSSEDAQKLSSNFARDVMDKALSRVENKVSQQRTSSIISEVEETNTHGFSNAPGINHISGIYRWVEKEYEAQVYNFGKRLMFEFIIPEPAAFYIQAKLKAYEFYGLEIPEKPSFEPEPLSIKKDDDTDLAPVDISTSDIFNSLRLKYDLSEFSFPAETKVISFKDKNTGQKSLNKSVGAAGDDRLSAEQYSMTTSPGYMIEGINIVGAIKFFQLDDNSDNSDNNRLGANRLIIEINGSRIVDDKDNKKFVPIGINVDIANAQDTFPIGVQDGEITLDIAANDLDWFTLIFKLYLKLDPSFFKQWQIDVFRKIRNIETLRLNARNDEKNAIYRLKYAEYETKKNELTTKAINDLIQGKSESYNRDIISKELKKHCLTMMTKEFDADVSDDNLSSVDALGEREFDTYPHIGFKFDDSGNSVKASFEVMETKDLKYPAIDIDKAKDKARYIQFLEQAFEWQQLAYIFYPYFWAEQKKWIGLMDHLDYSDKNMSDFLQAGSVRVLLAVQPSYNHAVLHYLATHEPWDGGPVPVIGDSLYIPLFEEIHKQQDDLLGAKKEGKPWKFVVPTSLIYLQGSADQLPPDKDFSN